MIKTVFENKFKNFYGIRWSLASSMKQNKIIMQKTFFFILLLVAMGCHSQKVTSLVKGQVVDATDNSPLTGVVITQKGTANGTSTNANGEFSLLLDSTKASIITVSFIGFEAQEIKLKNDKKLLIALVEDTRVLDEVVITAYSKARVKKAHQLNLSSPQVAYESAPAGYAMSDIEYENEEYANTKESGFIRTYNQALTTFAADVDRASYSNIRRFINNGNLPPQDAVRVEEMINYFDYSYEQPTGDEVLAFKTDLSNSPFNQNLQLLRVALQTEKIETYDLPASNLVFLIDVSGSMGSDNKLGLLVKGFKLLVSQLRAKDRVAIVTYAGSTRVALKSTSGKDKEKIMAALEGLMAGGSTAGAAGIDLAYKEAEDHFLKNGNNRIILATDGDFNVGASSVGSLEDLIEKKRKTGVFLSVLGFGMGNYKDNKMETLADKGNGNYAYIDNLQEARKVFITEFGGTLHTVAKDVKIQIEFNPKYVKAYRLIGYENRILAAEDFDNDQKDAGDLGAGHSMTALYEIIPSGVDSKYLSSVDNLKYQKQTIASDDFMTLKVRYKDAKEEKSVKKEIAVPFDLQSWDEMNSDFRFASAVAGFGMILKDSEFKGEMNLSKVIAWAQKAKSADLEGQRSEFIQLVKLSESLNRNQTR